METIEEYKIKGHQKFYLFWKRIIGFLGALIALLLIWWFLLIIAIIQKCTSKGPVLFKQKRVGKNGKEFTLLKFRSMYTYVNHEQTSEYADVDKMVTPFGKFLRKTSIDELPQILNILIGNMAWIGPRPLINVHEDHETIEIRKQNGSMHLRPGLSGLAQVEGRVNLDPITKGSVDGKYYNNISLGLDIKIFFKTIGKVFKHKDTKKNRN